MPTYQYACTECGHELEAVQSFTDDPLTRCPACEGRLRKVFNSVGVVFKGSGFYRTDSRAESNGKKNGKSSGSGGVSSNDASGEAKQEKKDSGGGEKKDPGGGTAKEKVSSSTPSGS